MATEWIGLVATGLVGVTGIVATVWVTVSGRRAEDRRRHADEKRQTYSAIFVQGDRVVGALKRVLALRKSGGAPGQVADALVELEDSRLTLNSAVYDLFLIASADVTDGTVDFYLLCLEAVGRIQAGEDGYEPAAFTAARRRLLNLMRADLGRSPLSIRDTPSMARLGANGSAGSSPAPSERG